MTFPSLDDLITYLYAFYDSMKLDTDLQFDFLPINVKRSEEKLSCKDEMASQLEAYFKDQKVRQAKKTQSNASAHHKYVSKIESLSIKGSHVIALSIIKYPNNCQEWILHLRLKNSCTRRNLSNLQEKILHLRLKKLCTRRNQSNLQE